MAWPIYEGWDNARDGNWCMFELQVGTPPQRLAAGVTASHALIRLPYAESTSFIGNASAPGGCVLDCEHYAVEENMFQPCNSSSFSSIGDCWLFHDIIDDGSPPDDRGVLFDEPYHVNSIIRDNILHQSPHNQSATIGLLARPNYFDTNWHWYRELKPGQQLDEDLRDTDPEGEFIPWLVPPVQRFKPFWQSTFDQRPLQLAYGYTAGAWYRDYPASLTLGSVVPSRMDLDELHPDDRTARGLHVRRLEAGWDELDKNRQTPFRQHIVPSLGLGVLRAKPVRNNPDNLTINYMPKLDASKLNSIEDFYGQVNMALDPLEPYILLPTYICFELARDFGLDYDSELNLFTVSESARALLRRERPEFVFEVWEVVQFSNGVLGHEEDAFEKNSLRVTLPYEAFEHDITLPSGEKIPYFPIRPSPTNRTGILGRVFFQEAYLVVDYHNQQMNLSRAAFPSRSEPLEILFLDRPKEFSSPSSLKFVRFIMKALWIISIVIGSLLALGFLVGILIPSLLSITKYWHLYRLRRRREKLWVALHLKPLDNPELQRSITSHRHFPHIPSKLEKLASTVRSYYNYIFAKKGYKPLPVSEDDLVDLAEGSSTSAELPQEEAERRRRKAEEEKKRKAKEKKRKEREARRRAAESGKKFGRATVDFVKRAIPWIVKPIGFAFTWPNFLADFKERDARRRAARRRELQDAYTDL